MRNASSRTAKSYWRQSILAALVVGTAAPHPAAAEFRLEEATIADIHGAIQSGEITCKGLVQAYLERTRAYNGVCAQVVTADGKPIPAATGTTRAGAPLRFPTKTTAAASVLPSFDDYQGPPLEFGRLEPTASDPSVKQEYGMVAGFPNAW